MAGKGKGPRVHDFRFSLIVHRLEQWIHEHADINAWLPVLHFYVGHSDMGLLDIICRLQWKCILICVKKQKKPLGISSH